MEPIRAADARDKMDMFKGIGISANDPFEQFRKNKSQGFIQRMRSRDDGWFHAIAFFPGLEFPCVKG